MSAHVRKVRENRSSVGAMTIAEVGDELRSSESSVLRLIHDGQIRAVKVGARKMIVLKEDLLSFLRGGEKGGAA
jgi:excisionase family DNA binding protein